MTARARRCGHCRKELKRRTGENRHYFERRKHCNMVCEKKASGTYWSAEAVAELLEIRKTGVGTRVIADLLSGRFGLGKVSKNMVLHRLRFPYPTGEGPEQESTVIVADDTPPPPPEPRTDKAPNVCRYGDCRLPRQPGRDGCAEHHHLFFASRVPRVNATLDIFESHPA